MTKIEKLTPEQEAYLPVFRQEYFTVATSPRRADREKLEVAIAEAYAEIGKEKPMLIILQSPQQAMMSIRFMKVFASAKTGGQLWDQLRGQLWDQLWGQLGGQLWDQLRGQLWDQLWDQLRGQLWDQLRGQLWDQLWGQLGGQLWDQLRGQLWDQLRDQLRGQLRDQLRGQLGGQLWDQLRGQLRGQPIYDSNYLWGSQDLYWVAWAKFAELIGAKYTEQQSKRLDIMKRIGFECEWWWPYEGICFVSERPIEIHWNDQKRLHNPKGPAIYYEDGYELYAWNGMRVEKQWIENPASITLELLLAEGNTERRRVMREIFGEEKFFLSMLDKCKLIDEKDDISGRPVKLYMYQDGPVRNHFVFVENGTIEQDGTRHKFTIRCKNINNDAFESVFGTYPDLMGRLADDPRRLDIMRSAIRT